MNNIVEIISRQNEFFLREMQQGDQEFLEALFRTTRDFLLQLNLPEQQINMLIKQQFQMQKVAYQQQFPDALTWIIYVENKVAGKITLVRTNESLHIVDIIFAPEVRSKGYGSVVLKSLQLAAQENFLALTLTVDQHNIRAQKLYAALGFITEKTSDTHNFLRWESSAK